MHHDNPGPLVQQEHLHLGGLIASIRNAGETERQALVAELADLLAGHFGSEESPSGWMDQATRKAPHHADLVDELKSEHGALLAAANGMAAGHGDANALESLLRNLEEHERREASIIADLWYEEHGGLG